MKKTVIVLLMTLAATGAFADFQLGAVGLYAPASASAPANVPFGVEARWKFLYAFQVGVSGLYLSGTSPSLAVFIDIGATVDLPPFTIGGAIGPDFSIGLGGAGNSLDHEGQFQGVRRIQLRLVLRRIGGVRSCQYTLRASSKLAVGRHHCFCDSLLSV